MRAPTLYLPLLILLLPASPAAAQELVEITDPVLDRFATAYQVEQEERASIDQRRVEIEERIQEWRDCAYKYQLAGDASGRRLGRLAARAGMRVQCGANDESGFRRELAQLRSHPLEAGSAAGGFTVEQFALMMERILGFLAGTPGLTFTDGEREVLGAREDELRRLLASELTRFTHVAERPREARGARRAARPVAGGAGAWTPDRTWEYISELFITLYLSGSTLLEEPYEPGQWTRWETTESCEPDQRSGLVRAFLGAEDQGGEWWRVTSIDYSTEPADTAEVEVLFRVEGEHFRQLERARARMPGESEAQELMVPQIWAGLWSVSPLGAMFRPTEQSIAGATVATDRLETPAGSFQTRQVRFRAGDGGRVEWWLSEEAPGGMVRFRYTEPIPDDHGEDAYCYGQPNMTTMELIAHGEEAP